MYYEEKLSGSNTDHPEVQRMITELEKGDTVIVHEIPRHLVQYKT
ncbi:recombinase family protein [Neobacillus sp. LXY-4]